MSGDGSGPGSDGAGTAQSPQPGRSTNDANTEETDDTCLQGHQHRLSNKIATSSAQEPLPPLPPRQTNLDLLDDRAQNSGGSLKLPKRASRPQLLSKATTALSLADVHTQSRGDNSRTISSPVSKAASRKQSYSHFARFGSEGEDSASIKSYAPTLEVGLETESLLGDIDPKDAGPAWKSLSAQYEKDNPFEQVATIEDDIFSLKVRHEFDELEDYDLDSTNEEALVSDWKAKLKHFFILSGSGKPIYSRHGNDQMISNYIGIVQTLISFYQGAEDKLEGFMAGDTRFVVLQKGPLNLVAISRLGESDAQLRVQLESMYMQILSTLTLPSLERMFSNRPSTDLRRPLQGTDVLLDGLADGFTRGSPSTLLSALECLRLRKTHRMIINDTLLKVKSPDLLYGLVLAAGRLVSVVRPKKHSLHPGDLHLIFNMLFEAGSVKAGGGENWIPLCLPGFNNTGFLYMYVSFFSAHEAPGGEAEERPNSAGNRDEELAIVLISANKEGFYDLRKMRNDLVQQMSKNGSMIAIKNAVRKGYASCNDVVPGTVLCHFLYKSRGNVQFTMPSFEPHFQGLVARRKLMSLYHNLHESIHSRTSHLKVHHTVAKDATALAWETPLFELYCVAGPQADRAALAQGANRVVQWIRREEERVFIIGGAVF
ncbi:hypothetical protein MBLNU230_g3580t1 [Neophaeotheca triangularis]